MRKTRLIFLIFCIGMHLQLLSQNVGIGTKTPTEKLNVDSGNIRIGKSPWTTTANSSFLKFGDVDYVTLGEEEGDDKLTIRAKEVIFRTSPFYSTYPLPLSIKGSANYSHFNYGTNEDTYIRGGKANASVIINDIPGGKVGIGMSNPTRAMLEQYGAVANTAAIFGGDGQGISLQQNWPAIGFNHYYNGASRAIGSGWGGQLAMNPGNGTLQWSTSGSSHSTNESSNLYTVFSLTQAGRLGLGINNTNPTALIHLVDENIAVDLMRRGIRIDGKVGNVYLGWNIFVDDFYNPGSFSFARDGILRSAINSNDGSYWSVSDERKKKAILPLQAQDILQQIQQLNPVSYLMKEETENDKKHFGFLSQELEKIFPELVADNSKLKLMNYTGLIPILTKGIQQQQQQIELLQKENAVIKLALEELKKMVLEKK